MAQRSTPRQDGSRISLVLLAFCLCLLLLLAFWMADLRQSIMELEQRRDFENKITALMLPISFLTGEPECANILLAEMGIDNVHVRTQNPPANSSQTYQTGYGRREPDMP